MTDDRYNAHPDDYDNTGAGQGGGYTNTPPSYTVPGSPGQGGNLSAETYYPATPADQSRATGIAPLSRLAVAGMIVSIASLLLNLFGLTAIVGIILSAVAFVRDVKGRGERGKGFAIAGIIIGAISLVLLAIFIVGVIRYLDSGDCVTTGGTIHCDSRYSYNSGNY